MGSLPATTQEVTMQVRHPKMDFSKIRPHWAPNHEFAQSYNANSMVPAHIEPYLIRVMNKAKAVLDTKYEELHRQVEIFNRQEGQHYKQHIAFNKCMIASGYDQFVEHEKAFAAEYARFLNEKSLKFNCAYCEGFEAMGVASARVFLEHFDDLLLGADPEAVDLWKWHLAEEFEHRTVAYDVYMTLFGKGFWNRYVYRVYGFVYAALHIHSFIDKLAAYLLAKDREGMTPEQLAQSKARERDYKKRIGRLMRGSLLEVLSPSYNPANKPVPRGLEEILARFEPRDIAPAA